MSTEGDTSIVVGIDGLDESMNAARWGAAIAAKQNAPLTLAYAISIPLYYLTDAGALMLDEFIEQMRDAADEILGRTAKLITHQYPSLELKHRILTGPADLALVAASESARMVIVGANNAGAFGSRILGSTAAYVASNAACPVVAWRGDLGRPLAVDLPVVVGVDGSSLSESAVAHAFEYASLFGVTVVAVHAWNDDAVGTPGSRPSEQALLSECIAGWADTYPDVLVVQVCEKANPAAALLHQSTSAQLLVVGSHARSRLNTILLGSTSQSLIQHAPCPTMICR